MSTNHHTEPPVDVKEVTPRKRFRFPELDGVEITAIFVILALPFAVSAVTLFLVSHPIISEILVSLVAIVAGIVLFGFQLFMILVWFAPFLFMGFLSKISVDDGEEDE